MKIIDKTPYRTEAGEIDLLGRIQGTLKFGFSWYNNIKAQDVVLAIINKQLDSNYALLRNVTLPNTEITLPMVLLGPPGVYLLNVAHERGIFTARDDQWGTMMGDRLVPARINQLTRTQAFGRVLQLYLDRQGFKGSVVVESVLLAADPGMQIESTRPVIRVVMSDALERFAASLNQARPTLNSPLAHDLAHAILVGRPAKPDASEAPIGQPEEEEEAGVSSFGGFSFDDEENEESSAPQVEARAPVEEQTPAKPAKKPGKTAKKKGPLGLTTAQLMILGGALLFAFCLIAAAFVIIPLILPNG
jgi:hypothetical protein